MRPTTSLVASAFLVATLLAPVGCGKGTTIPSFSCVKNLDLSCKPLFDPPTFQDIYDNTLHPTCASGSGTCHTSDAALGGLVFENPDTSYNLLLGKVDGRVRVNPGDPACSLLVERLDASDPHLRMPPGPQPLPAAEICTIVQWIEQGAKR